MIGSSRTGSAFSIASLKAIEPATLNAFSEESTRWYWPSKSRTLHVLDRVAGERRRAAIASAMPFSTAGMKPFGIEPPLISSTNSKPGARPRRARSRCGSRRTGRGRRSASCSGRGPWRACGPPPGRGRAAGAARSRRRSGSFIRSTITSTWTWVSPAMICSPVCWSRWTSSVGSSSSRRRIALAAFSSSPLVLGSKANAITGAGRSQRRERDLRVLGREHVAGAGLLQLRDGADVAGAELVDLLVLLALRDQHLADALLGAAGDVGDLRVAP